MDDISDRAQRDRHFMTLDLLEARQRRCYKHAVSQIRDRLSGEWGTIQSQQLTTDNVISIQQCYPTSACVQAISLQPMLASVCVRV